MSVAPEYVDFVVANEDWNIYELEDKSILKSKFVLINVLKREGHYGLATHHVIGLSHVPTELRKPPESLGSDPSSADAEKVLEKEDLEYKTIKDVWNVYRLDDGTTLSFKNVLAKVSRSSLHNQGWEPIYIAQASVVPKVKRK